MVSPVNKYFSQIDLETIKTAVEKAEQSTSGELAVELASHSRNWMKERLIHSLVFALICSVAALYFTREVNWGIYYNTTQTMLWGAIGFVITFFGWGQYLKRAERRRIVVWERALKRFGQLTPTQGHTGVLIFVSLEEEQASIVADKAIASKVQSNYWDKPQAMIAEAMSKGQHAEGIIQAIEKVAGELANHFPRESDDINELPDAPEIVD